MMTQEELIGKLRYLLIHSKTYEKISTVRARKGSIGEKIITQLKSDDKSETISTIKNESDYVITNPGGEEYIISGKKLKSNYDRISGDLYQSKGIIKAIEYTGESFEFEASWGSKMFCLNGDTLAAKFVEGDTIEETEILEVYRIGRREMAETYLPII